MIEYIRFNSGYPLDLPALGRKKINFRERITVLYGPNGTGKTTILQAAAEKTGCGNGGWSVGPEEINNGDYPFPDNRKSGFDADIKWDGRPVFYHDCYRDSEISFFNPSYFGENELLRSSGEKRIGLINELINFLEDKYLTYKTRRGEGPTLLLDEVDNHIGFGGQSILWKYIFPLLAKKYQLIISTHSVFPLLLRMDDVIALDNSYPDFCLKELGSAIDKYNKK